MSLYVDIKKDLGDFRLDFSFEAENGITSLLGASGSGKSLTLKCIAGIEKPDQGRIELDGRVLIDSEKRINLPPRKRGTGYLFQTYALFPNMTVRQNILCGLHAEKNRERKEEKLRDIIEKMRLGGLEEHKPHQLSGGQAQRTALARILMSEPRMLLLDEPFSALDSHLRDSLKMELRDMLQSFGKEVLMVTHSRDEAYNMSSWIGVMSDGKLQKIKPSKELFSDPETIEAARLTGCKNITGAHKISDYEIFAEDWGITLRTSQKVKDGLLAVGIRAHHFDPLTAVNRYPVTVTEEMEDPFETILRFRFHSQKEDSVPVWWRLCKEKHPESYPSELGIAPEKVLLLYE
jgi:molybdate transport system ATP-binding protein